MFWSKSTEQMSGHCLDISFSATICSTLDEGYYNQRLEMQKGYYLSPISRKDKQAYQLHYLDPTIAQNFVTMPYPYPDERIERWIEKREEDARNPETYFAIRRRDGFLIGGIGCIEFIETNHILDFGFWLAKDYRGLSIMPVAIQTYLKHIYTEYPSILRTQARVAAHNQAACQALLKAGCIEEGSLRNYFLKQGECVDAKMFSFLGNDCYVPVKITQRGTVSLTD